MIHVETLFSYKDVTNWKVHLLSWLSYSSFPWGLLHWALCCMVLAWTLMLSVTILKYATPHNIALVFCIPSYHGVHKITNFQFTCFRKSKECSTMRLLECLALSWTDLHLKLTWTRTTPPPPHPTRSTAMAAPASLSLRFSFCSFPSTTWSFRM